VVNVEHFLDAGETLPRLGLLELLPGMDAIRIGDGTVFEGG
jgi:hypothetical protein